MRRSIYNIIKTTDLYSIDSFVSLVAPHKCFGCGETGHSICANCIILINSPPPSRCFNCQKVSDCYKTCRSCKRILAVDSVINAGPYDGIHKQLVMSMKKDASRAAAQDIGAALASLFAENPHLHDVELIVPVATIPPHIRERGFDHSKVIALRVSKLTKIPCLELLGRTKNTRQVGKSRQERLDQMQNAVKLKGVKKLNGVKILLIDDISTTGATLSASARVLKQAGASRVDALVFASGN